MKKPRRTRVSATGEIKGYSDYITERDEMKERMIEVFRLAFDVNEACENVLVCFDYSRMGTVLSIRQNGEVTTYWSTTDYFASDWIVDPDFEKAEVALKAILKEANTA